MFYWFTFAIFILFFLISTFKEPRLFRNAIYFLFTLLTLFLAITNSSYETAINTLMIITLYVVIPMCLLFISFIFIYAGVIAMKRESVHLRHGLSIAFGIGIWFTFFIVAILFSTNGISTLIRSLLLLIAIIGIYIIFTFAALFIYSQLYRLFPKDLNCDFIIVHGAGLINGTKVSPLLAGRLNKGIEVFNASGKKAKIIVSGGQGSDEKVSEALAMKNYLIEKGISNDWIILEDKSKTTFENIKFSKEIMDRLSSGYKTIFVTNDYHVFRTGTYAKKVGLAADGIGCKTAFYYWPNAFIREFIAVMTQYKIAPMIIFALWLIGAIWSCAPFNF